MGFIGYRPHAEGVRVFLECQDDAAGEAISCTYPVDVIFTESGLRLEGVQDLFSLKKFYKLVNALEERARENGRDRTVPFRSVHDMLTHLRLLRNARQFVADPPRRVAGLMVAAS